MNDPKQDVLFDAYEQWRLHPITKELIKNLEKHKQTFVECIAKNATIPEVSDASVRHLAVSIKDFDVVLKIITNYETFVTLTNRK